MRAWGGDVVAGRIGRVTYAERSDVRLRRVVPDQ